MLSAVSSHQTQRRNLDGHSPMRDGNVLWLKVRYQLSRLRPPHKIHRDFVHVHDGSLIRVRFRRVALAEAKRNQQNERCKTSRRKRKEPGENHAARPLCRDWSLLSKENRYG